MTSSQMSSILKQICLPFVYTTILLTYLLPKSYSNYNGIRNICIFQGYMPQMEKPDLKIMALGRSNSSSIFYLGI